MTGASVNKAISFGGRPVSSCIASQSPGGELVIAANRKPTAALPNATETNKKTTSPTEISSCSLKSTTPLKQDQKSKTLIATYKASYSQNKQIN